MKLLRLFLVGALKVPVLRAVVAGVLSGVLKSFRDTLDKYEKDMQERFDAANSNHGDRIIRH